VGPRRDPQEEKKKGRTFAPKGGKGAALLGKERVKLIKKRPNRDDPKKKEERGKRNTDEK